MSQVLYGSSASAQPSGSRARLDPYDPQHVTMQLVIDLQSTNLVRQQEILRLRTDLDQARSHSHEQLQRAKDAEKRIRDAIITIDAAGPRSAKSTLGAVRLILEPRNEPQDAFGTEEVHLRDLRDRS